MSSTAAIETIERRAIATRAEARNRWTASRPWAASIEDATQQFLLAGRLTVNFHPDRIARGGHSVAAGLAFDGHYRSQWTTGVSAGSRSAMPGGERQRFESEFFDGAYETSDPSSGEHPVYGALDLLFDDHGGSPRFGSCFLELRPTVRDRTTLSLGDSHILPPDVGTFAEPSAILAGLAEQARDGQLLNRALDGTAMRHALEGTYRSPVPSRDLDGYIEAQVHGGVSLAVDVAAVVIDPSFRGTAVERELTVAAGRYGFKVRWHSGSELHVDDVPNDFRGPTMPTLASQVAAANGIVDAAAIGVAAAQEPFEEPVLQGDGPDRPLQQLKYLWHTVLANGRSARPV